MNKRIKTIIIVGFICSGLILGIDKYFKADNNNQNRTMAQVTKNIESITK